ncbi:MAG: flagellar motor protein MotD [Gammaproteobacteria bacterium]|nr:flagellar motor protein MotD [Gammaproteobacteria bacterium]
MMRKKRQEADENHERWLISYADFITLLFAFFVVMYSVSSVNEGKYRVLSDSVSNAFSDSMKSMEPIQVGTLMRIPAKVKFQQDPKANLIQSSNIPLPNQLPSRGEVRKQTDIKENIDKDDIGKDKTIDKDNGKGPGEGGEKDSAVQKMADDIEDAMASLIDEDLISVRRDDKWIEVEINSSILFLSGSAVLSVESLPVLRDIAEILKAFPNEIKVEGFTDDIPINTPAFPSNWELSASRAASVVHLFTKYGVAPKRMLAIGYGEYSPIADNTTEQGRQKNRRVVLLLVGEDDVRRQADITPDIILPPIIEEVNVQ